MRLTMSITYDVSETTPEAEAILETIVGEESRAFAETVRRRLADAGVTDLRMSMAESHDTSDDSSDDTSDDSSDDTSDDSDDSEKP